MSKVNRRGFIKLSGATLFAASMLHLDKLPIFDPRYPAVVINMEDVANAKEFFAHFEIPMSKELTNVIATVEKAGVITPKSQHQLKMAVCRQIAFHSHPAFADKMFKAVRNECKEIVS